MDSNKAPGSCLIRVAEGMLDDADLHKLTDALRPLDLDVTIETKPRDFQRFDPVTLTIVTVILTNVALPVLTGIVANAAWQDAMVKIGQRHGQSPAQLPVVVVIERHYENGEKVSEELRVDASGATPQTQDALVHLAMEDHVGCPRCKLAKRRRRHRQH